MPCPYLSHTVNRDTFLKQTGVGAMLKSMALQTMRHAYWRTRGYQKGRNYYLSDELNYFYRTWRDFRRLSRLTQPLATLAGKRFVYYPLHLEPEVALQGLSPEYFYQHALIAAISRDLPAGVLLAVKETFAGIGRRPENFYDQINDLKNVVLVDTMELGLDCVRHCEAVVTIAGTGGMEAAIRGTPVITVGQHNIYNCLPHVWLITDEAELPSALQRATNGTFDHEVAKRDGARFLQAVVDHSFDLNAYDYVHLDRFDDEVVDAACRALAASVDSDNLAAMSTGRGVA